MHSHRQAHGKGEIWRNGTRLLKKEWNKSQWLVNCINEIQQVCISHLIITVPVDVLAPKVLGHQQAQCWLHLGAFISTFICPSMISYYLSKTRCQKMTDKVSQNDAHFGSKLQSHFGSKLQSMKHLEGIITYPTWHPGPLLLTWINFNNPSMDQ